jgi:hypothetical protein
MQKCHVFLMVVEIVIYTTREEGKAYVHANCMFGHDAQRSGRCNSSEQKRPYSRVLYLILFDSRHNSLENAMEKHKIQNKQTFAKSIK